MGKPAVRRHADPVLQRVRRAAADGSPAETTAGAAHSFVYGLATSRRIPAEYTIIKNGAKIDASKLKKYDVVTLDAANRQAIVSDTRLSGKYQTDSTTYSHPSQVEILGQKFSISSEAAATFKDMKLNDYITLLFDADGNVAAAVLKKNNITLDDIYEQMILVIGKGEETNLSYENITPALRRILNASLIRLNQ